MSWVAFDGEGPPCLGKPPSLPESACRSGPASESALFPERLMMLALQSSVALFGFRGGGQQGGQQGSEQGFAPASGVVHEFEEGKIAGQLLLRDTAMRPQPGAQQRPNTFHGVNVDFAEAVAILIPGILAPTMVDGLVAEAPLRQSAIDRVLVGVDQAAERDAGQEQWLDRGLPNIGQQMQDYGAAALNHAENRRLLLLQRAAARHPLQTAAPACAAFFATTAG